MAAKAASGLRFAGCSGDGNRNRPGSAHVLQLLAECHELYDELSPMGLGKENRGPSGSDPDRGCIWLPREWWP